MPDGTRVAHNRKNPKSGKVTSVREAKITKPAHKTTNTKANAIKGGALEKRTPLNSLKNNTVKQTRGRKTIADEPWLAADFHPTKNEGNPSDYSHGTKKKIWWLCSTCGHEWQTRGDDRLRTKSSPTKGCPGCVGRVATAENNMEVKTPWMTEYFHPVKNDGTPKNYTPKSGSLLWWNCSNCGHEWEARAYNIYKVGADKVCPACAGRVPTPKNCMATTHEWLAKEFHPDNEGTPQDYFAGTGKKLKWLCSTCGHEWETRGRDRVDMGEGRGCASCAVYSFKPKEPAVLYVMQGPRWAKIGISNTKSFESRMQKHNQHGQYGEVIHVIHFETGEEARTLEKTLKVMIRQMTKAKPKKKLDGYTEAFPSRLTEVVMGEIAALEFS